MCVIRRIGVWLDFEVEPIVMTTPAGLRHCPRVLHSDGHSDSTPENISLSDASERTQSSDQMEQMMIDHTTGDDSHYSLNKFFDEAFPFHFKINRCFQFTYIGHELGLLVPGIKVGDRVDERFVLVNPTAHHCTWRWEDIARNKSTPFAMKALRQLPSHDKQALDKATVSWFKITEEDFQLTGGVHLYEGGATFLMQPTITTLQEMNK